MHNLCYLVAEGKRVGQEQIHVSCPKCSSKVAEDALFCDCGEYFPEQTVCIDCGFISSQQYHECPRCGSEILGGSLKRLVTFSVLISVLYWFGAALWSSRPSFEQHQGTYWTAAVGIWIALIVLDVGNWSVLRPKRKAADVFKKALADAKTHEERERVVTRIQHERESLLTNLHQLAVHSPEMEYLAERGGHIVRPFRAGLKYARRALLTIAIVVMLLVVLENVCYEKPIPHVAWLVAGVAAVFVTVMCFGYTYAGYALGLKKARVAFLMIAGVILVAGTYFLTALVMELFEANRATLPPERTPAVAPRSRHHPAKAPRPAPPASEKASEQ